MANSIPVSIYNQLGDINVKKQMLQLLKHTQPVLTEDEKEIGIKTRYFAKYQADRHGSIYELSLSDYNQIENNPLFQKTKINWIIKGRLEDTVLTLIDGTSILIKGVISQNQALLAIAEESVPGILQHVQNHMEYWIGE